MGEICFFDVEIGCQYGLSYIFYGVVLYVKDNQKVKKGEVICEWDLFNVVIIFEFSGVVKFEDVEEGVIFCIECDD